MIEARHLQYLIENEIDYERCSHFKHIQSELKLGNSVRQSFYALGLFDSVDLILEWLQGIVENTKDKQEKMLAKDVYNRLYLFEVKERLFNVFEALEVPYSYQVAEYCYNPFWDIEDFFKDYEESFKNCNRRTKHKYNRMITRTLGFLYPQNKFKDKFIDY